MRLSILLFALSSLMFCVDKQSVAETELMEMYTASQIGDSIEISNLQFKELISYDDQGRELMHEYYDGLGILKGKEIIDYSLQERQSKYYGADELLLSYYDLKFKEGQLASKSAHAADNYALLRQEVYTYDDNGNRVEKVIAEANGVISRVYSFAFDKNGNELGFSSFDKDGNLMFVEAFSITKLDEKNRWIEKFGLRDDKVVHFYKREFK